LPTSAKNPFPPQRAKQNPPKNSSDAFIAVSSTTASPEPFPQQETHHITLATGISLEPEVGTAMLNPPAAYMESQCKSKGGTNQTGLGAGGSHQRNSGDDQCRGGHPRDKTRCTRCDRRHPGHPQTHTKEGSNPKRSRGASAISVEHGDPKHKRSCISDPHDPSTASTNPNPWGLTGYRTRAPPRRSTSRRRHATRGTGYQGPFFWYCKYREIEWAHLTRNRREADEKSRNATEPPTHSSP